jgi:CubicO group peptidase (beta-lactamase class C family)
MRCGGFRGGEAGWWFGFARSYGYLWWQGRSSIKSRDIDWVGALGRGGQRLYVVPNLSLIVAVTAGLYESSNGGPPSVQENLAGNTVLNSFVLPAALAP